MPFLKAKTSRIGAGAPKAPLCKGGWQNRLFGTDFDWGIVMFFIIFTIPPALRATNFIVIAIAIANLESLRYPLHKGGLGAS